jgi:hypothetical protein
MEYTALPALKSVTESVIGRVDGLPYTRTKSIDAHWGWPIHGVEQWNAHTSAQSSTTEVHPL